MGKAWFAPKRYGYGASLPIAWQGWVALLAFIVGMSVVMELPRHFLPTEAALAVSLCSAVVLVALFVLVARAKTEGGWRWRNGEGP